MLSLEGFVEQSLRINLVFLRISKEHSLFLESSFTQRNTNLTETAGYFRRQFNWLLQQAVGVADGVLPRDVLESGQIITVNTLNAELLTQKYIGTVIDTALTKQEEMLQPGPHASIHGMLEPRINELNRRAITAATALAEFVRGLIADVKTCRLFMNVYPLLMDHILRETTLLIGMLVMLQNRQDPLDQNLSAQEAFWNRVLGDHAAFTRGMLDPTEEVLISTSNQFSLEFYKLADAAAQASSAPAVAGAVTGQSLQAAKDIRDFDLAGTRGLLQCRILSMLIPLMADHDAREANYYIYQIENGAGDGTGF